VATLPQGGTTVQTGHIRFGTEFVEKNELVELNEAAGNGQVHAPANYVRTVLLLSSKRFL
jgi:hypothetical protein